MFIQKKWQDNISIVDSNQMRQYNDSEIELNLILRFTSKNFQSKKTGDNYLFWVKHKIKQLYSVGDLLSKKWKEKNENNEKRSARMMWVKKQSQWWNVEGPELEYVNKKTDSSFQRYKSPLQGWSQSIIKPTVGLGIIRLVSRQQIEVRFEETAK